MAKKSRRTRQQVTRVAEGGEPVRIARPIRPPAVEPPAKKVDFAGEYHYVIQDLRRIAIYAAALFVLLIVLAVVIG
jgi:hypothetical protein